MDRQTKEVAQLIGRQALELLMAKLEVEELKAEIVRLKQPPA